MSLLYKPVATTSTLLFFLQLDELEFAKWLENILQIALSDAEMDVAYIQPMKRNLMGVAVCGFWVTSLAILFRLRKLSNNWYA